MHAYPTKGFTSCTDCIEAEIKEKIVPALGCMVPWISDRDACEGSRERLPQHEHLFIWLYGITRRSWGNFLYKSDECRPPCSYLTAHSTKSLFGSTGKGKNHIELYILEQVEVEKILLAYDSGDLLVEIGSCLGLWLGLSVVGIYDIAAILTQKCVWSLQLIYQKIVVRTSEGRMY